MEGLSGDIMGSILPFPTSPEQMWRKKAVVEGTNSKRMSNCIAAVMVVKTGNGAMLSLLRR